MTKMRLPLQQGKSRLTLLSVALLMVLLLSGVKGFSQAAINSTGAAPDGSAMLDVSGTSKGVLINRMSAAQMTSIATPANGLIIFNTDCNALYYNAGTTGTPNWVPVNASNNTVAAPGTITGSASVCASATGVAFSIAAVAGATSYTWTLPTGATIASGAGTNSITVNFGSTSGNVCVSAYINSCQKSAANCLAVTVASSPALTAGSVTGTTNVCPLSSTVFTAAPSGGTGTYAYQWYNGTAPIAGATNNTFSTGPVAGAMSLSESFDSPSFPPAGWFVNVINDGTSGNSDPYGPPYTWLQTSSNIYISPPATPHSGSGMAWYDAWDANSGAEAILATPSFSLVGNVSGAAVSFWMWQSGQGTAGEGVNVYYSTVDPSTQGAVSPSTYATFLGFTTDSGSDNWVNVSYTIPSTVKANHVWLIFDDVCQYDVEMYIDDVSWVSIPSTSYSAVVTSGCNVGTTSTASLTFKSAPGTDITGTTSICAGQSTTLTAPAGSSYVWNNGLTTQAITARYAANYTVTVTGATGCTSVVTAAVSVGTVAPPATISESVTATTINWYWSKVSGATSYYYNTTNDFGTAVNAGNYASWWSPPYDPYTYHNQTITLGCGDYPFYVWTINACGHSPVASAQISNGVTPPAPTAGSNIATSSSIVWSWSEPSGVNSYKWGLTNVLGSATDLGTSQTLTQLGLTCNTAYTIYVWAYNACGTSTYTTLTQLTTPCTAFACGAVITDARDNQTYNTVQVGPQCWMARNLNYGEFVTAATGQATAGTQKFCYSDLLSNCYANGGLYEWGEIMDGVNVNNTSALALGCNGHVPGVGFSAACTTPVQGICPTGWHIPSYYEWILLAQSAGNDPFDFIYSMDINQQPANTSVYDNLLTGGSTGFNMELNGREAGGSYSFGPGTALPMASFFSSSLTLQTNNSWYAGSPMFWNGAGMPEYFTNSGPVSTYGSASLIGPATGGFAYGVRCVR